MIMLNKAILMGRLTADPESKVTTNGISVCTFTLAVQRDYTPKGQDKESDFINCVAWRNTAEFISKYFAKGQLMAVEGSIQSRRYETKDGQKRSVVEVIIDEAHFAGDKAKQSNEPIEASGFDEIAVDDLPF